MPEKQKYYPDLVAKISFPKMEEEIIQFWEQNKIFEQSVQNRSSSDEFIFYDGPPFANGMPHYGHIMVSYVKDTIARFQTMIGKRVERRLGWDCHGLPAEIPAEKQLGVSGRKAIEEFGIDKFNAFCRQDVLKYTDIWVNMFKRIGRWVDFGNDYKTMDLSFMESVIHNFKELYDKGLIYEDFRVQPYSWAAQTPLSNFEVNQEYKDKTDAAITVMFKLQDGRKLLVWTTTPWTLPSNLMIAVGKDINYAVMQEGNEQYILAESLKDKYKQQLSSAQQIGTIKGSDLIGLSYEPMFPYFEHLKDKAFKVISGEFVSTEDGTGIVHIAPGFGVDDFDVCRAYDAQFPIVCPVDEAGCFTSDVPDYQGKQVFETNEPIMIWLKEKRLLVKKEQITHSYPFCWRTDTPLIYKAMSGWFVRVTDFKDKLIQMNEQITWTPEHIKNGRFGKGLESAPDWSISRNRFWGTPVPVWVSDDPKFSRVDVFGSLSEIKEKTGFEVTDLHRPMIDDVIYPNPEDPTGQSKMHRVPYVLDCWFESGSMPYGVAHYPFENKAWFDAHFPADFIVEGVDQTRGWFYSLHVLGTALQGKPAYKHCLVTGLLMAESGVKLSKKLKNYPDPYKVLDTMGADTLRWFLISSPATKAGNAYVSETEMSKVARKALTPLYNAFYFFCLYANAEGIKAKEISFSSDILDRYILSKTKTLGQEIKKSMLVYDMAQGCNLCSEFLDILNNWYIRRSRVRFWDGTDSAAFNTLYTVLTSLCKIMAPMMPMTTDYIYKNLTGEVSVHLEDFPTFEEITQETLLIQQMDLIRTISSTAKSIREENKLRNRMPLKSMTITGENVSSLSFYLDILKDEVNVKDVILMPDVDSVASKFLYLKTPLIGKRLGPFMGAIMSASKTDKWILNGDGTLSIAGQLLTADEFELRLVLKEGKKGQPLPDNTAVIQLDTQIVPVLEREGIARDFVRMVQQARKDKNFNVSDRIVLSFSTSSPLIEEALQEHMDYIKEQVLAESMAGMRGVEGHAEELGDSTITFHIEKR